MADTKTISQRYVDFAQHLKYSEIPADVRKHARFHLLDCLGVILAADSIKSGVSGRKVAQEMGGVAQATIAGLPYRTPAANAALANGMMAHGIDFDDTHTGGIMHISTTVVPAAMAIAETVRATGAELLTAVVAGNEIGLRIGIAGPAQYHGRGFHTTSVAGVFAATVAAGKLLRLSDAQMVSALGLAGSMASGLFAFVFDGTDAKQLNAGWAAHGGVWAALLAAKGLTGPATVFEGPFGFLKAYLDRGASELDLGLSDLGLKWHTPDVAFKLWPCGQANHGTLDAMVHVMRENDIKGDQIQRVVCLIPQFYVSMVFEPLELKATPRTMYEGRFSLPYCIACIGHHGKLTVDSFTEKAIRDPDVGRLAQKVTYEVHDYPEFPKIMPGGVRVHLVDGRVFEYKQRVDRGTAVNPRLTDDVLAKFRDNSTRRFSAGQAEELINEVLNLGVAGSDPSHIMQQFQYNAE